MQDMEQNKNDFVIEKIKERPINKKKLLRRTLITAFMAVMFGLIACFTFLILEPVISNWLYPKEEPQTVFFPEDQEEMEPGEMLSENITPEDDEEDSSVNSPNAENQGEMMDLMESYQWTVEDYAQLYAALGEFSQELEKYIVTVTASRADADWLDNTSKSKDEAPGVIVGNNGRELLILTTYSHMKNADTLSVTFFDDYKINAQMKEKHIASDMAIVAVNIVAMGDKIDEVKIAPLGSSGVETFPGTPVIALGRPTGEMGSVCYGMVTSENGEVAMTDASFGVLTTSIYGTTNSFGFLFNLQGQMIGVITTKRSSSEFRNMVTAFEINDLKRLISRLSNGFAIPHVGITGTAVSTEIHEEGNVPKGIYVKTVVMDSPAMKAGIQPGDVIVSINNKSITKYKDYFNALANLESNDTITLKVMRLSVNEFKELKFEIVLGKAE